MGNGPEPAGLLPRLGRSRLAVFVAGFLVGLVMLLGGLVLVLKLAPGDPAAARRAIFNQTLADYLAGEGPAVRGPLFEKFALLLNVERMDGLKVTEAQLLNYAGPPNSTKVVGDVRSLAFSYTGQDGRAGSIVVTIRGGLVDQVGFGGDPVKSGKGAK